MKTLLVIAALLTATATVPAYASGAATEKITPCRTDGCVMLRNAQTAAVWNYIQSDDECETLVSYLFEIKRVGDHRFNVNCGDVSEKNTLKLLLVPVTEGMEDGNYEVRLLNLR